MFLRLPRHPIVLLVGCVTLVAGILQWLLFPAVSLPEEYLGIWSSGRTTLEVRENGVVNYRTGDGVAFHSVGGIVSEVTPREITYRVLLLPRRLRIDTPPRHKYDDVWTMTVEGQELWLMR